MTRPLTSTELQELLRKFAAWVSEHAEDIAVELAVGEGTAEPMIVAEASPADISHGSIILAVFTARAAMRKAMHYFAESPTWQNDEKQRYLTIALQELQDAIQNCSNAIWHLGIADSPGINTAPSSPEAPKGGAQ